MEKCLIWDWNGTLLDDVPAAVAALNRMLAKRSLPPVDAAYYRKHFGFPVRPFYAQLGVDLEQWDWDEICEDFHSYIAEEPQTIRGDAVEALELAAGYGFKQCVLSALRQDLLEDAIESNSLHGYFDFVYGVDNLDGSSKVQRGLELAAAVGDGMKNSVMIGDTLHDSEVAKAIGAQCILVSCGHQLPERLAAAGCIVAANPVEAVKRAILWKEQLHQA